MIAKHTCSLGHKISIIILTSYWIGNKFLDFFNSLDKFTTTAKNSVNKNVNNLVCHTINYWSISFITTQLVNGEARIPTHEDWIQSLYLNLKSDCE